MTLDEMYATDGLYLINGFSGMFFVEVESGVCHQLNCENDFERDGELNREGWTTPELAMQILKLPFVRCLE